MLDHELRTGTFVRREAAGRWLLALLLLTEGACVAWAGVSGEPRDLALHFVTLGFEYTLLVLAVCAAGATALAAEHERFTLDLVRVTPLTPAQIVGGKLAGVVRALFPCLAVPLVHLAWASALGVFSPLAVPLTLLAGAVVLSAWAVFAMSQSLDQADPHRAVMRTMGALGIFGVLLALTVGAPAWGVLRGTDTWVGLTAGFGANPVGSILWAAAITRTGGSDAQNSLVPAPGPGSLALGVLAGSVWLALHALLGWAVYRHLAQMYRSRVGS